MRFSRPSTSPTRVQNVRSSTAQFRWNVLEAMWMSRGAPMTTKLAYTHRTVASLERAATAAGRRMSREAAALHSLRGACRSRQCLRHPCDEVRFAAMLPDLLVPGLRVVFVGTSVSTRSAAAGHDYANPTNKFWQLLAATELAEGRPVGAPLDTTLPEMGLGLTDLVKGRASSADARLEEQRLRRAGFSDSNRSGGTEGRGVRTGARPQIKVARYLGHGSTVDGPADWRIGNALVYRLPSSSAAAAIGTGPKMAAWREFGAWVRQHLPPES